MNATNPYAGLTQQQLAQYLLNMISPYTGYNLLPSTKTKTLNTFIKDYTEQQLPTFKEVYNPYIQMYSDPTNPMSETMLDAFGRVEQGFVPEEIIADLNAQGISLSPSQEAHLEGYASAVAKRDESIAERAFDQGGVATDYGLSQEPFILDPELVAALFTRQKTGLTDKQAMQQAADVAMEKYLQSATVPLDRARTLAAAELRRKRIEKGEDIAEAQSFEETSMFYPEGRTSRPETASKVIPASEKRADQTAINREAMKIYSQSLKDAEAGVGGNYAALSAARAQQRMVDTQAKFEQDLAKKIIEQLIGAGTPLEAAVKQARDYLARR